MEIEEPIKEYSPNPTPPVVESNHNQPEESIPTQTPVLPALPPPPVHDPRFDWRVGEFITGVEAARRLGINASRVNQLTKTGRLKVTEQGRYVWPHVKHDYLAGKKYPLRTRQPSPVDGVQRKRSPRPKKKDAPPAPQGTAPSPPSTDAPTPPSTVFDISLNIKSDDLVKLEPIELLIEAIKKGEEGALGVSYQYGRTMTELLGVREQQLKILKLEDSIIDRTVAMDYVQKLFQHMRNIFLNLPERVATEFAEEAGIDRRLAFDLLSKYIHKALNECSTTEPELP